MTSEIAILGAGCRYPDARSPDELWHNALAGRRAFRAIPQTRLRVADYAPRYAGDPDSTYVRSAALLEDSWRAPDPAPATELAVGYLPVTCHLTRAIMQVAIRAGILRGPIELGDLVDRRFIPEHIQPIGIATE